MVPSPCSIEIYTSLCTFFSDIFPLLGFSPMIEGLPSPPSFPPTLKLFCFCLTKTKRRSSPLLSFPGFEGKTFRCGLFLRFLPVHTTSPPPPPFSVSIFVRSYGFFFLAGPLLFVVLPGASQVFSPPPFARAHRFYSSTCFPPLWSTLPLPPPIAENFLKC